MFNSSDSSIRIAQFAGSFYPDDKNELNLLIGGFLQKVKTNDLSEDFSPKILIVPHAGYIYSGPTAAYAYQLLAKNDFKKVIMLGIAHDYFIDGGALYDGQAWDSPLGKIEIDNKLIEKLDKDCQNLSIDNTAHASEHSLEVQLPFLQTIKSEIKMAPILLGMLTDNQINSIANSIAEVINGDTILIVSSDLSHYPRYEDAVRADQQTIEAILSLKVDKFDKTINRLKSQRISGLGTCACGADAIKVAIKVANKLKLSSAQLLDYRNSGDTAGDKNRVVGYAAMAIAK